MKTIGNASILELVPSGSYSLGVNNLPSVDAKDLVGEIAIINSIASAGAGNGVLCTLQHSDDDVSFASVSGVFLSSSIIGSSVYQVLKIGTNVVLKRYLRVQILISGGDGVAALTLVGFKQNR